MWKKIHYFSDGAASQNKIKKIFINLTDHFENLIQKPNDTLLLNRLEKMPVLALVLNVQNHNFLFNFYFFLPHFYQCSWYIIERNKMQVIIINKAKHIFEI